MTGGRARVPGLDRLAAQIFNLPVALARASVGSGASGLLEEPEHSTALGLVKLGAKQHAAGHRSRPGMLDWLAGKLVGA